ncbi:MAG TPA: dihydroorotate dehydrogenase electron transfer subunit [Polyangiaceae bacterium]|nr:dihydroorotate dehydrogenase electron transfer subunit [Polyangiaceae bacterium]
MVSANALGASKRRLFQLPLLRRESMGPSYHLLTFEAGQEIVAFPGQFAMVRGATWGQAPLLPRPMSLLEPGRRPAILIKIVGEGSRRLAHASPGEPFDLLMPLGNRWSPCPAGQRPILVAGGVGIAPLLFFARELAASGVRATMLYGGRSASDLPLSEEVAEVSDARFLTEDGSRGTRGRVTALLESAIGETRGKSKVYACGPDRMMAKVAEISRGLGVPCEVSLETPMACGYGVCLGCPVKRTSGGYLYACMDGPCVDAAAIAWEP